MDVLLPIIFGAVIVFCIIRDIIHPVKPEQNTNNQTQPQTTKNFWSTIKDIILFPFYLLRTAVLLFWLLFIRYGIAIILLSLISAGAGYLLNIVDSSFLYVLILIAAIGLVIIVISIFKRRY